MIYVAYNLNEDIRKISSSGGVFYSLAKYILEQNGIVFGAAWNKDWLVDMCYVDNLDDLPKLMGSKYIQANIKETFKECKEFLEADKLVLYSGLPCQLHGLKLFLKKEYENLILVDIACHGLMPLQVWKDYLETIKRPDAEITSINFRLKDPDWINYKFEINYSDGKTLKEHHNKNKYIKAFLSDKYLKISCYNCKFKNEFSCADMIIGDAWGQQKLTDTTNGVSFIKTLTEKGEYLLKNNNDIKLIPYNYTNMPNGCLVNKLNKPPEAYNKNIFRKKVAIITLHLFNNIGGILQAFALNKLITDAGYLAETFTWKDSRLLDFAKNNIKLRIFNTAADIKNINEDEYDIFVVGSDQIWRKKYCSWEFKNEYINIPFLYFTNHWTKTRIAYAASIGVAKNTWEYNNEDCNKIANILKSFNALSVRELQSIEDCQNKFGINVNNCLDPTILLNKEIYLNLCNNVATTTKDLFIYLLDETTEKNNAIDSYCLENNITYFKATTSVEEWLAGFRDAKYIFTDSFHGCIFSIIFHKPFICLYNKDRGNARFDSLILLFKLNNIIYNIQDLKSTTFTYANYDLIEKKITESTNFLLNSLALPANTVSINSPKNNSNNVNNKKTNKKEQKNSLYTSYWNF